MTSPSVHVGCLSGGFRWHPHARAKPRSRPAHNAKVGKCVVGVDSNRPRQAARIFAKVLGHVEARGRADVARTLEDALRRDEPLLLALAPPAPAPAVVAQEELP